MQNRDLRVMAPGRYVAWINQHIGFNPRGQQHSNALSHFILDDLRALSSRLDADFRNGALLAKLNTDVDTPRGARNVDLVVRDAAAPGPYGVVRCAIEHKTLMTAHGKARKNRQGDIIAAATHVHNHSLAAIVAATMIVNTSQVYRNPDAFAQGIERTRMDPAKWQAYLRDTLALFTRLPLREDVTDDKDDPEAVGIILVEYDGEHPARLVTDPPSPQEGEPGNMLVCYERLIRLYEQRFP